jgi:hypothetical protein
MAAMASAAAASGAGVVSAAKEKTHVHGRFFQVQQRHGRWWFVTPEGRPFFSLGLNHVDSATLRYPKTLPVWKTKYGNCQKRWLTEAVRPDLVAWGFNTIGWVQEVVTRGQTNHRHSRNFIFEEYQWLDMPYCHMLPFADFHQWEAETKHPDFFSKDFEDWCDYVARAECARFADDPKLVGYFYIDCPTWVHTRPMNEWKGPLFDPDQLESDAGSRKLFELASRYYQVAHDAIRRYDRNHLILGDRYEGKAPLPDVVLQAAKPYVDVLSFQHFSPAEQIRTDFLRWHELTGMPVLLADACGSIRMPDGTHRQDPDWYRRTLATLREVPACVGFHLCGAYQQNHCRGRGLRLADERPDTRAIEAITDANRQLHRWVAELTEDVLEPR